MPRITPNLWFDTQAEEAARFYTSIFPDSEITDISYYGEAGPREAGMVLTVDFVLDGQPFTALNGGPQFTFDAAVSFVVDCADQEEVDYYWDRLTEGGQEVQCGWVTDKFGLSWQVVPHVLTELVSGPDHARAQRAIRAMLGMKKLDVAALLAAADAA
jgi:predicted 3-demethylubiquinone-9 3-methyltransferase (glyoxalase superfamily)